MSSPTETTGVRGVYGPVQVTLSPGSVAMDTARDVAKAIDGLNLGEWLPTDAYVLLVAMAQFDDGEDSAVGVFPRTNAYE